MTFKLVVKISHLWNTESWHYYSWILWRSNSRLNAFFIKQLINSTRYTTPCFLNNTPEHFTYPLYFSKSPLYLSKAQSTSKLIIFINLKLKRANSRIMELNWTLNSQDFGGPRIESWVKSLWLVSDCHLTFELYFTWLKSNLNPKINNLILKSHNYVFLL